MATLKLPQTTNPSPTSTTDAIGIDTLTPPAPTATDATGVDTLTPPAPKASAVTADIREGTRAWVTSVHSNDFPDLFSSDVFSKEPKRTTLTAWLLAQIDTGKLAIVAAPE